MQIKKKYMLRAIELAASHLGKTAPNPSVGCVIVSNDKIIAEAATAISGSPHAERIALDNATGKTNGSDMYVTLEPCSHKGKNLPCVDFVIASKPARVIIANRDPNPLVNGEGIAKLKASGIEVVEGFCEVEAFEVNKYFFKRITKNIPYVTVKIASSLDGKIGLSNGDSKWITGEEARNLVQQMRVETDALLTGVGTVLADDPKMDVRIDGLEEFSPFKFIIDRDVKTPKTSNILLGKKAYIFASKFEEGFDDNVEIILLDENTEHKLNLRQALEKISQQGLSSVLVEAGTGVISNLLEEDLIDEIKLFTAPKILGSDAKSFIFELNLTGIEEEKFEVIDTKIVGKDTLTTFRKKSLD